MNVELSPKAAKYLKRLNEPLKRRIKAEIRKLEHEPPKGDIKAMTGQEGFRLRVGDIRILFRVKPDCIIVEEIGPRGQIYKRR